MKDILKLQMKIIPEIIEILEQRYNILRNVYYNQPIGRRTLANNLNIGERIVRSEVNILKEQGLIKISSIGMTISDDGLYIINEMKDFIHTLKDLHAIEKQLEEKLKIKKVVIVPGNCEEDELVIKDVGKISSKLLLKVLKKSKILGITGGNTMAQLAEEMQTSSSYNDLLVVPARGGMGKSLETQSNNIAAKLAQKLDGTYKLLHVPDNIGREAYETLLQIAEIRELIDKINDIDTLVFGMGRADKMARRRNLNNEDIEKVLESGAVAEAFGYYFNTEGKIIKESSTVGLSLESFKKVKNIIGVACGSNKAEAILAISSLSSNMTIVIDEGAARKILSLVK